MFCKEKGNKALISLAQVKVFPHEISPLQLSTPTLCPSLEIPVSCCTQLQSFISSIRTDNDIT